MKVFTPIIEFDPETKLYIGVIPGIAGAHTQGATLEELKQNLKEVLALCLMEQFQRDDIAWALQRRGTSGT